MPSRILQLRNYGLTLAAGLVSFAGAACADSVINEDLIVQGSACIGQDCINGESFGNDTLILKENDLRILFKDNSTVPGAPTNDWRITINDGTNKFSIDDVDGGRTPFTIEAGAPDHALYVDDGGRIGLGTNAPATNTHIHIRTGNSPTLRLEQDGSNAFQPQTFELGGNESAFFVRDLTAGSTLPFRIRPGAPTDAFVIEGDGDVGVGAATPEASLHVRGTSGTTRVYIEEASGTKLNNRILLTLENKGAAQFALKDTNNGSDWRFQNFDDKFRVNRAGTGVTEMSLDNAGNLTILGTLTEGSDKNAKIAIESIDPDEILEKIAALDVSAWTYKRDADTGIRHIGPMAQDFHALFGLGATETGISTLDTSGVALAAIKALQEQNAALLARIEAQQEQNAALLTRIEVLESAR